MIRHCPRTHADRETVRKSSFSLFKPLMAVATGIIMFELLPMDFQSWIAPSLVSYEEVFWATHRAHESLITESMIVVGRDSITIETDSISIDPRMETAF